MQVCVKVFSQFSSHANSGLRDAPWNISIPWEKIENIFSYKGP